MHFSFLVLLYFYFYYKQGQLDLPGKPEAEVEVLGAEELEPQVDLGKHRRRLEENQALQTGSGQQEHTRISLHPPTLEVSSLGKI